MKNNSENKNGLIWSFLALGLIVFIGFWLFNLKTNFVYSAWKNRDVDEIKPVSPFGVIKENMAQFVQIFEEGAEKIKNKF